MNFLRWYTLGLALLGLTMAITLGVVCLIYMVYLDTAPKLREEWPVLIWSTLMFSALAAVAGVAFQGLRADTRWKWFAQAFLLVALVSIGWVLQRMLFV